MRVRWKCVRDDSCASGDGDKWPPERKKAAAAVQIEQGRGCASARAQTGR
jgi:hypothetical protein